MQKGTMALAQQKIAYEFGPFRLDVAGHTLLRDGEGVPLPPKAFDTLTLLVQRQGILLGKEELLNAVWPDCYVEENNLNQYISMLRKTLGENGEGTKYIETIPRLGYRFVAPVRELGQEATAAGPVERKSGRLRHLLAGAVVLMVVVLFATDRFYWTPAKAPPVAAGARTLAVLPLRNLKPDGETDFLSMALADAIINRLGHASEISVQPLSAVARYHNRDEDPRQIARELKVKDVLAGSYVREGDTIRITTELISADTNAALQRDSMELKYEKLLAVQDRVAASVIHSLGLELRPEELDRMKKGLPANPQAYEYYLRGMDLGVKSDFAGATRLLEQSVALEPGNAMAWTELGTAYLGFARVQDGGIPYAEKGWAAFQKALALDPDNPLTVDVMSFQLIENNKIDEAIPLLRRSLRQNPLDSYAHWYLSEAYRYGGALEQSVREGELALKLNPNVAENLLFNTYLYAGEYEKFLASLPAEENNARTVFYRGLAYESMGKRAEAVGEFERAFTLNPALLHAQIGRAIAYAQQQRYAEGLQLMGKMQRTNSEDGEMVYKMAQAYAQLGDMASALRLLHRSIELNFYPYGYFERDPLLDPIRKEARFADEMETARQRQEAFVRRFTEKNNF